MIGFGFSFKDAPNFCVREFEDPQTGYIRIHPLLPVRCQLVRDLCNIYKQTGTIPPIAKLDGEFVLAPSRGADEPDRVFAVEAIRGENSVKLRINSACRMWSTHVAIYERVYGDEAERRIVKDSKHLIQNEHGSGCVCCAVDLARPKVTERDVFRLICQQAFTFVKEYDTFCHCDLRGIDPKS